MDIGNPLHNSFMILMLSYTVGAVLEPLLHRFVDYRSVTTGVFASNRTYELIGVTAVRWGVVKGRLNCNPGLKQVRNGQVETLVATRIAMTSAEFGHWIGFVAMLVMTLICIALGCPTSVIVAHCLVNVIGNAYLSLVQQYNRRRVDRLITSAARRRS